MELVSVDLSHNAIERITDCDQLKLLPKLAHLDLKVNKITDKENIVAFVAGLQQIVSIHLNNNPCIRLISNLKKQLVIANATLFYLDER